MLTFLSVQAAIAIDRPLIVALGESIVTEPVGGRDLTAPVFDVN